MRSYSLDDVLATRKRRDSWWTVFMVDPVACRVALFIANRTEITPNALTRFSLILGMASAACFAGDRLVLGAVLFYVSFMVDCVDGKIARLKGTGTPFGLWLDYVGDRIRVVCCAFGIAYGQYAATGRLAYVLLGAGIAILDLFRYVNAPQMKRVRQTVKIRRRAARREELAAMREAMAVEALTRGSAYEASYGAPGVVTHGGQAGGEDFEDYPLPAYGPLDHDHPHPAHLPVDHAPTIPRQASASEDSLGSTRPIPGEVLSHAPPRPGSAPGDRGAPGRRSPGDQVYDQMREHEPYGDPDGQDYEERGYDQAPPQPPGEAEAPVGARQRLGRFLVRYRVRTHLMSGIEFHAAVFVMAPLMGPAALLPVTAAAGGLLVVNEIFLVYRMWLSTRALGHAVPRAPEGDEQPHVRTDPFFTGV